MGQARRHGWHATAGLSMQAVTLVHRMAVMALMAETKFKRFHANFVCKAGITVNCKQILLSIVFIFIHGNQINSHNSILIQNSFL